MACNWGLSQTLGMAAKGVGSDRTSRGEPSLKTVPIRPVLGLLTNFATGPVGSYRLPRSRLDIRLVLPTDGGRVAPETNRLPIRRRLPAGICRREPEGRHVESCAQATKLAHKQERSETTGDYGRVKASTTLCAIRASGSRPGAAKKGCRRQGRVRAARESQKETPPGSVDRAGSAVGGQQQTGKANRSKLTLRRSG
jgi:hypothetical protein